MRESNFGGVKVFARTLLGPPGDATCTRERERGGEGERGGQSEEVENSLVETGCQLRANQP